MEERSIFRIIIAIMAMIGFMFFACGPHASDYYIGGGAVIFAASLLYIVEFYNKN